MESFDAISLVVISLGAFLLPLFGSRLKIPSIVLEIAFGIIVGPVLHLVSPSEFISGLAVLGFLLLMFLSGFEIELDTFREKGMKTLALPILIYLLTVAVSFVVIIKLLMLVERSVKVKGKEIIKLLRYLKFFKFVGFFNNRRGLFFILLIKLNNVASA